MADKIIKILLTALVIFGILTAEEPEKGEHEASDKPESKAGKGGGGADKKGKNKKLSYLEKVQSRYVSRLPYIMVPVMIVTVIKKGDLLGYLTIMPELKGKDVESYRKLWVEIVKIQDEIFCDLFSAMSILWIGPEPPTAEVIEGRIKKRLSNFFKKELVEKVKLHFMEFTPIRDNLDVEE